MPLVIRDISTVPNPDGWKFYCPHTNYMIIAKNYHNLYPEIVKHYSANGMSPPGQQEVIDYQCNNLHIPCYNSEDNGPLVNSWYLGTSLPPRTGGCCG